ncbi:ABC transporter substrate-binding protein [Cellulomonas massiliensis]|uniref:ABC transporter substrate-binding protein n=1 Tax=Cellulomonas massiliensis TaxID=1465811 RepID=UPI00037CDCBC|nr:extracellular solute-binding protein [Cellulomonas massiliensis]
MRTTSRKFIAATAGAASIALLATACSTGGGGGNAEETTDPNAKITLTVATFNDFGYTDELLAEYTKLHPNITVKQTKAAKSDDARQNLTTKIAAGGAGLADIEAIENDWLVELLQVSDKFLDLKDPAVDGRWPDWKNAAATSTDGRLIGYGTDIGPEGICYRTDLFEKAGLPTDRAEVAELIGGDSATWDSYFDAGKKFVDETGIAWFDSAGALWQGMVNQVEYPYENEDGSVKPLADNTEIHDLYNKVLEASVDDKLSAGLAQWEQDWTAAFTQDKFATMLCPAWMTGPIKQNAGDAGQGKWDVADVFPGGGGNWGGSWLTVPASGKNTAAAKELAAWLTAPEQQIKAFENAGTFPSQIEAQKSQTLLDSKNEYFNDAPVGQIFSNRAAAITVSSFRGPNYFKIGQTITDALRRVDVDKSQDAAAGWDQAVKDFNALGL